MKNAQPFPRGQSATNGCKNLRKFPIKSMILILRKNGTKATRETVANALQSIRIMSNSPDSASLIILECERLIAYHKLGDRERLYIDGWVLEIQLRKNYHLGYMGPGLCDYVWVKAQFQPRKFSAQISVFHLSLETSYEVYTHMYDAITEHLYQIGDGKNTTTMGDFNLVRAQNYRNFRSILRGQRASVLFVIWKWKYNRQSRFLIILANPVIILGRALLLDIY